MAAPVFIPCGEQTDFSRNYAREGLKVADLIANVGSGTLRKAEAS